MQFGGKLRKFLRFGSFVIIGLLLIGWALVPSPSRAAEDFTYSIRVSYDVNETGNTHVSETYNVTNNTSNRYLDSIKLSTPTDEVKNLSVRYSDGAIIESTIEKQQSDEQGYSYEYQQINIKFPRRNAGQGTSWSFTVNYDTTKLVESKGNAHIVYIPAISPESSNNYNVSLTVPSSFGTVHGVGFQAPPQIKVSGKRQYTFDRKDLIDHSVALLFGDSATYQANFNFPLENPTSFNQTFTITLPPNMPSQEVYINRLDPQPQSTSMDLDGNIIATYQIPAKTKLVVKTDVLAVVKYIEYDLAKSGTVAQIPRDLVTRYTGPSRYWQSGNPDIVRKAKELTANKPTVAEKVRAINDYVIATLTYNNDKIQYNIRQGALKALEKPDNAVCLEYSDLTISLLRAAGIPARMPIGYGYSGNLKTSSDVADSLHSWVETYVPGIGWMNLDPTWGEKFNNFGRSDLDHFAFALWGTKDGEPVAVTANGRETSYQYENTQLSYTTFTPHVATDASIGATKWMILPYVSVVVYNGRAPGNVVTSDLAVAASLSGGNTQRNLSSLAPGQKFWGMLGDFGPSFAGGGQINLVHTDQSLVASAPMSVNPWPMIAIITLALVLVLLKVIQLLSKRSSEHKDSDESAKAEKKVTDEQPNKSQK